MIRQHSIGLRHGQLLAGIEGARAMLEIARRSWSVLPESEQSRIQQAIDLLAGIERRAREVGK